MQLYKRAKTGAFLEQGKEVCKIFPVHSLIPTVAHQETTVEVEIPNKEGNLFEEHPDVADVREKWLSTLADLKCMLPEGPCRDV